MPLGACISRADIMDWPPGAHASTFSGNPLSVQASLATIDYIKKHKLDRNAERLGKHARARLRELQEDVDIIGDVRGRGLMIGAELVKDRRSKEPAKKAVSGVLNSCFKKGLVLLSCGESVVRLMPPLTMNKKELDQGLDILCSEMKKLK
jgi:4-aminobutyrate aminotransferase